MKILRWHYLLLTGLLLDCWRRRILGDNVGGRHVDTYPVACPCGLILRRRDCSHEYQDDGTGESEPVDFCPKCGREI